MCRQIRGAGAGRFAGFTRMALSTMHAKGRPLFVAVEHRGSTCSGRAAEPTSGCPSTLQHQCLAGRAERAVDGIGWLRFGLRRHRAPEVLRPHSSLGRYQSDRSDVGNFLA